MAQDVLKIPLSVVASELDCSVGGKVLDAYQSSLNLESLEAIIDQGDAFVF